MRDAFFRLSMVAIARKPSVGDRAVCLYQYLRNIYHGWQVVYFPGAAFLASALIGCVAL